MGRRRHCREAAVRATGLQVGGRFKVCCGIDTRPFTSERYRYASGVACGSRLNLKHLYFVRHGRTEWNAIGRMQGQWNSDLDAVGRAQADINGRWLATQGIEAMFASPLDRTRQTAAIISRHVPVPTVFDDRLKEWDCGDWSGHLRQEVARKWPLEWQAWQRDPFGYRGPNCETYADMIARSAPFLAELHQHAASRIAIVSHGMIGKAMLSTLLRLDAARTVAIPQPNDRVFVVALSAAGEADVQHFDAGVGPHPGLGHRVEDPPTV